MSGKTSRYLGVGAAVVIIAVWLMSGIFTVKSGEEAVVLRFGKYVRTTSKAGLTWHIPKPVESVFKVNVSEIRRLEIGFKTLSEGSTNQQATYQSVNTQSSMITGDENLVNVETAIQYKINDVTDYLFNVDDPEGTLKMAAESAIRRVIANHKLDEVLTDNKFGIQQEIMDDLQEICNNYKIGIGIIAVQLQDVNPPKEVDAAFKDVANAREDKNSFINESESYQNEIIPRARGNAAERVNKAKAYKEKRIAEAKGDVANFVQILEQYQYGKNVTRTRMYLETLEEILPGVEKYIVDGDGNTLKFLPLEQNSMIKDTQN